MNIKKLLTWLGAVVIITLIFGTIYTVAQQSLRLNANDPQIQLAEDLVAKLNNGAAPTSLITDKVNINASLAPFVIIYDKSGRVVAGSGYLNNTIPTVPYGVLTHATPERDNWITWQPQSDVRVATVEAAAHNYYVLSGRSMREVEKRETTMLQLSMLGWFAALGVLGSVYLFSYRRLKK